ncbi:MAG: cellulase family glycosylhydrolase [Deltaproteobacteria bacterium]|nr:cellulase family glycosylhydrolase [Deltaproteobacteria bacterium]
MAPRCTLLLIATAAVFGACVPERGPPSLHAAGGRLLDDLDREVVLRGINARVEGLFDVSFDDGRVALETIPPLGREDLRLLRDELGMNAVRVPIHWSGLQPQPGPLDEAYLERLFALLTLCHEEELWCVVDLHQDAYSKEIGEDGAPLWAIVPPPEELLEGPLVDLEERRLSEQVLRAFDTFFTGQAGVQDAYLEMLALLTERLRDRPFVAGLELFNEPVGDDLPILGFAQLATEAVHAVDPARLVLWEPNSLRNLRDDAATDGGLHLDNDAYAPHLYPEVFSGQRDLWASGDPARLVSSTANARGEADEHDAPLIVTEYGIDPRADHGLAWIAAMDTEMDRARASRFFWVYEELEQGQWGLFDAGHQLRDALAEVLARPAPDAIEGTIQGWSYAEDTLRVQFEGGGTHRLRAPTRALPDPLIARCDGEETEAKRTGALVVLRCGGDSASHEVSLSTSH